MHGLENVRHHDRSLPVRPENGEFFIEGVPTVFVEKMKFASGLLSRPSHL
jgi:hypothetical protein